MPLVCTEHARLNLIEFATGARLDHDPLTTLNKAMGLCLAMDFYSFVDLGVARVCTGKWEPWCTKDPAEAGILPVYLVLPYRGPAFCWFLSTILHLAQDPLPKIWSLRLRGACGEKYRQQDVSIGLIAFSCACWYIAGVGSTCRSVCSSCIAFPCSIMTWAEMSRASDPISAIRVCKSEKARGVALIGAPVWYWCGLPNGLDETLAETTTGEWSIPKQLLTYCFCGMWWACANHWEHPASWLRPGCVRKGHFTSAPTDPGAMLEEVSSAGKKNCIADDIGGSGKRICLCALEAMSSNPLLVLSSLCLARITERCCGARRGNDNRTAHDMPVWPPSFDA